MLNFSLKANAILLFQQHIASRVEIHSTFIAVPFRILIHVQKFQNTADFAYLSDLSVGF